MVPNQRYLILRRASWVGIVGNGVMAVVKVVAGFLSSSLAVVGDGIDTLTDVVTSLVTLRAARLASYPPDEEHPWGHARAETIATKTLSFVIVLAGIQLLILTGRKLLGFESASLPTPLALGVTILSVAVKTVLAIYKSAAAKKTGSIMMKADATNMRNDIFLSLSVLAGVFFTLVLRLPILDVITGLAVSLWIIYLGIRIFIATNTELMDGVEDREVYDKVYEAVGTIDGAENPHRVRIRKLNALHVIDIDIEVDGKLTVDEAHHIACLVEKAIQDRLENVFDIMVHVEPKGVEDHKEGFGLRPANRSGDNDV